MAGTKKSPKRSKHIRFHLDIPDEMHAAMEKKANALQAEAEVPGTVISLSDVARRAIWAYVK